ncbi:MAG: DUF421 domain-containing protein [Alicyclobacillus sp.]|nr:DUF421 domain-containing protein [Alicyclobacillus sp.]
MTVMVALRLMGKREIGQLSVFDFVVSMMIAELSTLPMEDTRIPLYISLLAIAALVLLQVLVSFLQLKSHWFRHWVEGEPVMLVEHGKIRDTAMKRARYSMNDLLLQLREQGVANVADVEFAVLENSGKLSVIPRADKRPLTPADVGQPVAPSTIPIPVVIDGQPVKKGLDSLRRDTTWLTQELARRGYTDLTDVFYAAVDANGTWWIDPRDERT